MLWISGALVLVLVLVLALLRAVPDVPDAGLAPGFTLEDTEGREHSLADYRGRVVILKFFTTWCPSCRVEMERLGELDEGDELVILAVNLREAPGAVKDFLASLDLDVTVLLDRQGTVGSAYGIRYIPTTVIVDGRGEVVHTQVGPMSLTEKKGWIAIAAAEAGEGTRFPVEIAGALVALGAGVLSFFSPCLWPLYPAYVSLIAGSSGSKVGGALAFVLGFSSVFVALGLGATAVGSVLLEHGDILRKGAGLAIIVLGLHQSGIMPIPALFREARVRARSRTGIPGALLAGLSFGLGWTPCVGPVLGAILIYAGSTGTLATGAALLGLYSLGLGIPFIVLALSYGRVESSWKGGGRRLEAISRAGGFLLIVLGMAIYFDWIARATGWIYGLLS